MAGSEAVVLAAVHVPEPNLVHRSYVKGIVQRFKVSLVCKTHLKHAETSTNVTRLFLSHLQSFPFCQ